jgi:Protein of unknown function (DUF1778)
VTSQNLTTDDQAKVSIRLPESFANTSIVLEQVNDDEVRIRKSVISQSGGESEGVAGDENDWPPDDEGRPARLSPDDARLFLEMMENPPQPNEALRRLLRGKRPG